MWPNPQFSADLVTFTEEILNGKLHFLCSVLSEIYLGFCQKSITELFTKIVNDWKPLINEKLNHVCLGS